MPRARVSTAMPMSHLLCAMKPSRTESAELPTITAPTTVSRLISSAPTCSAWTGVMTYMVPSPGPPSSMKRTRDSPFSRACSSTDCASWSIESSGILPEFAETIFSSNVCCRFGEPRVGGVSRKSMGTTAATSKPYWLMTLLSMVSTSVLDSASRKSSCPASPVPTSPRDSDILSAAEPIRSCSRFVFSWES